MGLIPGLGRSPGEGHGNPPHFLYWIIPWTEEPGGLWFIGSQRVKMKVAQSCPTLCNPMYYRVHGILQARILEWVTFPFPRGSSKPRDQTQVSHTAGGFFTSWATREAQEYWSGEPIPSPGGLPDPGLTLGSSALQADSLPTELLGKPRVTKSHTQLKWLSRRSGSFD